MPRDRSLGDRGGGGGIGRHHGAAARLRWHDNVPGGATDAKQQAVVATAAAHPVGYSDATLRALEAYNEGEP